MVHVLQVQGRPCMMQSWATARKLPAIGLLHGRGTLLSSLLSWFTQHCMNSPNACCLPFNSACSHADQAAHRHPRHTNQHHYSSTSRRVLYELISSIPAELRAELASIAIDGTSATAMLLDKASGQVLAPAKLYNESQPEGSVAAAKVGCWALCGWKPGTRQPASQPRADPSAAGVSSPPDSQTARQPDSQTARQPDSHPACLPDSHPACLLGSSA
jgi:hypothetical protein